MRWCLEFLGGKSSVDISEVNKRFLRMSVSDNCSRLKKTILLQTLQDELYSKASTSEWMLEALEVMETLLLSEDSCSNQITATMKDAYCAIAVECTIKYLEVETCNPAYRQAVERIWKGRVQKMEPSSEREGSFLFSPELKRWKTIIVVSLLNPTYVDMFASITHPRRDALKKLKLYLDEALQNLALSRNHQTEIQKDNETSLKGKVTTTGIDDANLTKTVTVYDVCDSSFREPNRAARTHKGGTSNKTRITLISPKKVKISPLKKYEPKKIFRRRKPKRWSELEEETLRTAVRKLGEGNWTAILNTYTFDNRTGVDLKDKWRNMERSGRQ